MLNICFFNSHRFWGGGEKLHLEYALGLKNRDHQVEICCDKNSELRSHALQEKIPCSFFSVGNLSFLNPVKLIRLYFLFKKKNFDALVFSSSQDMKTAGLAAKLAGIKNIVYLRGLASPVKNSFVNRFYFSKILTHIIANSEETKRMLLKHLHQTIDEQKIKIVYHGIAINTNPSPINSMKINIKRKTPEQVILGNAGRLTEQKGQSDLLEVAKILKAKKLNFILYIAGEGELKQILQSKIKESGLENEVVLLGFVSAMEEFYRSLDIFLLSSGWEGFGYVLVEAMMANKPVVAYNISSNPEIVENGQTGFLVDYKDLNAFAAKAQLLMENSELRTRMGQMANQRVHDHFLLEDSVIAFENCLK